MRSLFFQCVILGGQMRGEMLLQLFFNTGTLLNVTIQS